MTTEISEGTVLRYPMPASSPNVFVVDDNEAVRMGLHRLLCASGMQVQTFADAASCLNALSGQSPDCLVVDLHMPGMTGLDMLHHLMHLRVCVPVIVVTAYDDPQLRAQCLAAGAQAYLCKPFDAELLLETIVGLAH
jgi:FixJ family two-component response regulator